MWLLNFCTDRSLQVSQSVRHRNHDRPSPDAAAKRKDCCWGVLSRIKAHCEAVSPSTSCDVDLSIHKMLRFALNEEVINERVKDETDTTYG